VFHHFTSYHVIARHPVVHHRLETLKRWSDFIARVEEQPRVPMPPLSAQFMRMPDRLHVRYELVKK
jgi:hypothetical protein